MYALMQQWAAVAVGLLALIFYHWLGEFTIGSGEFTIGFDGENDVIQTF